MVNDTVTQWNCNNVTKNNFRKFDLNKDLSLLKIQNDVVCFKKFQNTDTLSGNEYKYYFLIPILNLSNKASEVYINKRLDRNIIAHQLSIKKDADLPYTIEEHGTVAFGIEFLNKNYIKSNWFINSLYFLFIILLFLTVYTFAITIEKRHAGLTIIYAFTVFYAINLLIRQPFVFPDQLADTLLFSNQFLGSDEVYGNLNQIIIKLMIVNLFSSLVIRILKDNKNNFLFYKRKYLNYLIGFLFCLMFVYYSYSLNLNIIHTLIFDSKISLVTDSLRYLNLFTALGIAIIMVLCINTGLMISCFHKITVRLKIKNTIGLLFFLIVCIGFGFYFYGSSDKILFYSAFSFIVVVYLLMLKVGEPLILSLQKKARNVAWQLWIIIFGIYSTGIITILNYYKEKDFRLVYANSQFKRPDNKFEFKFFEKLDEIKEDKNIQNWVAKSENTELISNYLVSTFFGKQENELVLDAMLSDTSSIPLTQDTLLYIEDIANPYVYKACLLYGSKILEVNVLFKDIYYYKKNRLDGTLVGSDLFSDNQYYSNYYTAKYKNNKLIDYDVFDIYPAVLPREVAAGFNTTHSEYIINNHITYSEIYVKDAERNEVVLVKFKNNLAVQIATTLSGIILLMLIIILYYLFFTNKIVLKKGRIRSRRIHLNINTRINIALAVTLFVSLLILSITIVYFVNVNNQSQNFNRDSNNITIVKMYLESSVNTDEAHPEIWSELMHKFNVIALLYDTTGVLIPDKRYNEKVINADFKYLLEPGNLPKIHVSYPFFFSETKANNFDVYTNTYTQINIEDKPYILALYDTNNMSKSGEDVTDIILVVINIFILVMFLASFITLLITSQFFKPLHIITLKFRKIALQHNEPIDWPYEDEFSILVEEYNKMIQKVESLAKQLSIQERENIWKEMAQQVAHEIKNPLTPMRLNIQYLQKAIAEGRDNIEEMTTKVSKIIIEQIETLNQIATDFSAFAKIDQMRPEVIEINNSLHNIINLFKVEEGIQIKFYSNQEKIFVEMDKSYLVRSINNVIKNAIQAIPSDREKEIFMRVQIKRDMVIIAIKDNGAGIAEEVQPVLFKPYFTSKSTGTGIGLSMTKNMIEMSGGTISFITKIDKGTIFYIKLPVYDNNQEQ